MERTRCLMVLVFALVFGLTAGTANAVLTAAEEFEYTAGESLEGLDGGIGWVGPWDEDVENFGNATIEASSLAHPTLNIPAGAGGHARTNALMMGEVMLDRTVSNAILDTGGPGQAWLSYLFTVETAPIDEENWRSLDLFGAPGWGGYFSGTGQPFDTVNFGLFDGGTGHDSAIPITVSQVYWIVVKVEFSGDSGDDDVYLWVDPPPGPEPSTGNADVSITTSVNDGFNRVMIVTMEDGRFDRIRIGTTWVDCVGFSPTLASSPVPADLEENVDTALALLEWSAPTEVTTPRYDAYFGTNPTVASNPKILDGSLTASVEPNDPAVDGLLAIDTQYYWRVDVNDPNGGGPVLREGFLWTFTTWPYEPIILQQPENTLAAPGGTAQFTCESGGNLAGNHTFTWYKQVGATQDEPNDIVKKGPTGPAGSDTLTLNNVVYNVDPAQSSEGSYYCKITNTVPGTTYSDSAGLLLLRLMAWYKFNANAQDSASLYHATKVGGAGFAIDGVQGQCLNLDGSTGYAYVPYIIGESVGTFEDFTIAAWVNPDPGEDEGVIWAGYDDTAGGPPTDGEGISIERQADGTALVRIEGNNPAIFSSAAGAIPAATSVSEVQTSTLDALMTSGTFTMTYNGQTTAPIAFNATKAQITAALNSLSTVSPGNIKMQMAHEPDTSLTCTWTFTAVLDDVPMLSMDVTNALPTTSADFAETVKGENHWTHVAFTYDSNDAVGTGTLYINGEQAEQKEYVSASAQQIGPVSMGAYVPDGGSVRWFFDGKLDDVRFYAYPITAVNVATLYNEMTFDSACVHPEPPEPADLNGDCHVDMLDTKIMADTWLVSNIVP